MRRRLGGSVVVSTVSDVAISVAAPESARELARVLLVERGAELEPAEDVVLQYDVGARQPERAGASETKRGAAFVARRHAGGPRRLSGGRPRRPCVRRRPSRQGCPALRARRSSRARASTVATISCLLAGFAEVAISDW